MIRKAATPILLFICMLITIFGVGQFLNPVFAQDLGEIKPPPGVEDYQAESGLAADQPALIFFISRMITLITIIAGLWTIVNVVIAGYFYIAGSGSAEDHTKVRNLLTMSVVGLLLIVASYTIGGVIGAIFFGDASYLLSPTI